MNKGMHVHCVEDVVTDSEIYETFRRPDIGQMTPRQFLKYGVLRVASGLYIDGALVSILVGFGLVDRDVYRLTMKGQKYLYEAFKPGHERIKK